MLEGIFTCNLKNGYSKNNMFLVAQTYTMNTHRNLHTVISLKLGDVLVPPGHLSTVEWPEPANYLDAGFCWVRHVYLG